MKASGSRQGLGTIFGRSSGEWLWGGLGLGVATASASFAAYMVVVGPGQVRFPAAPDFGLLAHLGPRHLPADSHAAVLLGGGSDRLRVASDDRGETPPLAPAPASVDFSPTGTVDASADRRSAAGSGGGLPALKNFILRDVFDGKALVETRNALTLVSPGTNLDGAGEVLTIDRRGEDWVVTTSRGLITMSGH